MQMIYPNYLLNPGDMFQVDVERVMYATGAPKPHSEERSVRASEDAEETPSEDAEAEAEASEASAEESAATERPSEEIDEALALKQEKDELKSLRDRVRMVLDDPSKGLTGKQKKALRGLAKDARAAMSRAGRRDSSLLPESESIGENLSALFSSLNLESSGTPKAETEAEAKSGSEESLSPLEQERLDALLAAEAENPYDPSKPYLTPWRPRNYMSAFAFIPRYLEVNPNICAAVYVRHPVARPGKAEVPTPFTPEVSQLAYTWYLRRR
jgi:hypothetical protein